MTRARALATIVRMSDHVLTPEERIAYTAQGARDFVARALSTAQQIAFSAQRGEVKVVEQYMKNLESLDAEAEQFWTDRR